MSSFEKMNKDLETELNLIRKELGVEELELKKEQQILPLLLNLKKFTKRLFEASEYQRMGPRGDLHSILARISEIIDRVKKDEKELSTLIN